MRLVLLLCSLMKFQMKYENPSCRIVPRGAKPKPGEEKKVGESDGGEKLKVGDVSDCLTKHIDPNSTGGRNFITKNSEKSEEGKVFHQTDSKNEGTDLNHLIVLWV